MNISALPRLFRDVPRRAFTLIELLVVIAIIALLVGLLLPALSKARAASWKAVSLSNIRQITAAAYTYREEQKQYMPLTLTYERGTSATNSTGALEGWCTWQYGGKNCDVFWAGNATYGHAFDVEAADRPLNAYMYSTLDIYAPAPPALLPGTDPTRKMELPVYRDPSERVSYERSATFETNPTSVGMSCYDDTGTSYQFNTKWWDQLGTITDFSKRFYFGCERMRVADAFQPSRFVWINDQYSDVIANNTSSNFLLVNGYHDINRSVMGFMDGHANYLRVRPGAVTTPGLNNSYSNTDYTFVFEDLKIHP